MGTARGHGTRTQPPGAQHAHLQVLAAAHVLVAPERLEEVDVAVLFTGVNWAQYRIRSASQHQMRMGTKYLLIDIVIRRVWSGIVPRNAWEWSTGNVEAAVRSTRQRGTGCWART